MSTNEPCVPPPLQWAEGMMLTPQHLQQNDIYWHALMRHQMAQLQPHYWGILDFALDHERLAKGELVVQRLHAVLPDGLVVEHPAAAPEADLQLDLTALDGLQPGGRLRIHVGVPVRTGAAASPTAPIQRYEPIRPTVATDENTGDGDTEVFRMRARTRLLRGDRLPGGYTSMPLVEVICRGRGQFELSAYHPPMLTLAASRFLGRRALQRQLAGLARVMRHKAEELAGAGGDRGTGLGGTTVAIQRTISALVTELPRIEALTGSGQVHPFAVYQAVCTLTGHLAALRPDGMPPKPDVYDHDDCAPAFHRLLRSISDTVDDVQLAYDSTSFQRVDGGRFSASLSRAQLQERLLVELRGHAGQSLQSLRDWLDQARVASERLIPELDRGRLPGAEAKPLEGEEKSGLQLPVTGVLVELVNTPLELRGKRVPVLGPDKPVVIAGPDSDDAPRAIVLYTRRPERTTNDGPGARARA